MPAEKVALGDACSHGKDGVEVEPCFECHAKALVFHNKPPENVAYIEKGFVLFERG